MGRKAQPKRRAELLDAVTEYILSHGLAGLSLRPLAASIHESPRMLLYFFGSKDRLVAEALTAIRLRQQQTFARVLIAPASRRERLQGAWELWSSSDSAMLTLFFFEAFAFAMRSRKRFPNLLERLITDWLPFFEEAFAAAGAPQERVQPLATLTYAAIRGLQLDLLATGERIRIDAAFEELLQLLSTQPSAPVARGRMQPVSHSAPRRKRSSRSP